MSQESVGGKGKETVREQKSISLLCLCTFLSSFS